MPSVSPTHERLSVQELTRRAREAGFVADPSATLAMLDDALLDATGADRGSLLLARSIARQGERDVTNPTRDAIDALALLRAGGRLDEAALAAACAAAMAHRCREITKATDLAVEALVLSRLSPASEHSIRAHNSLAVLFLQIGAFPLAYALVSHAFDADHALSRSPAISFTAAYIACEGRRHGHDLDRVLAERAASRLAEGVQTVDDTMSSVGRRIIAPAILADLALEIGDLDALESIGLDVSGSEEMAPRVASWYQLVCAAVARAQGRDEEAVSVLDVAIPVLDAVGDHHGVARGLKLRRDAWVDLGGLDRALADANDLTSRLEADRREHIAGLATQIQGRAETELSSIALSRRAEHLADEVATDALTGVGSRRWFDMAVAELAGSTDQAAVLVFDLDHFKLVNDRFGHQVGDEVLRRVGGVLRASFRDGDVVGRYGGEEFVVVLPRTSRSTARALAERVCRGLADEPWAEVAPKLTVRFSAGIASGRLSDIHDTIGAADAALYRAKRSGRNRIVDA